MRRRHAVAAACVAAAVAAGGAAVWATGDGGGDGPARRAAATSATTARAPTTREPATTAPPGTADPGPPLSTVPGPAPGDDPNPTVPDTTPEDAVDVEELGELLLDDDEVAAVVPDASPSGGGALDLEAAAELEADVSAERSLLQTRRFEGGVNRSFETPGGAVAYVQVYEFASAGDAEAYLEDGVEAATAAGAMPFEVPQIEHAVGLTAVDETDVGAFTGHVVTFVRGARHYLVVVGGTDGGPAAEDAAELAAIQLERVVAAEEE